MLLLPDTQTVEQMRLMMAAPGVVWAETGAAPGVAACLPRKSSLLLVRSSGRWRSDAESCWWCCGVHAA